MYPNKLTDVNIIVGKNLQRKNCLSQNRNVD